MLVWNPFGVPAILGGFVSVALGLWILGSAPATPRVRYLVATLVLGGLGMGTFYGVRLLAADAFTAYALLITGFLAIILCIATYALWLLTLVPWSTQLAPYGRVLRGALAVGSVAWTLLLFARPELLFESLRRIEFVGGWVGTPGAVWGPTLLAFLAVMLMGAVVTVDAWRRADTPIARRQMRVNAVTNILFNIGIVAYTVRTLMERTVTPESAIINFYGTPSLLLLLNVGLAYGMLKTHLFDVDLHIKRGINRGAIVAVFLSAFFVAVEVAQEYVSEASGVVAGAVTVGALALAFRHVERAAERLADRALPSVQPTSAYAEFRKMEVYKAALEELSREGAPTQRERRALDALRARLGIADVDARALEADVGGASGA